MRPSESTQVPRTSPLHQLRRPLGSRGCCRPPTPPAWWHSSINPVRWRQSWPDRHSRELPSADHDNRPVTV